MIVREVDLFQDMSEELVEELVGIMETETHEAGQVLFQEGDPARHMYIVEQGSVLIKMPRPDRVIHTAELKGEVVGWSSVAGRDVYTASAQCANSCRLIRVDKEKLDVILRRYPSYGLLFYKRLAGVVGERLILCHQKMASLLK